MDLQRFIYSDIGEDILKRFYDETAKEINVIGTLDDFLKLPKLYEEEIKKEPQKGYEEIKE